MYKYTLISMILIFLCPCLNAYGYYFYDDFEDNDISDWEARCAAGNWSVSDGKVHGSTYTNPALLAASAGLPVMNGTITTAVQGVHAFGLSARLDSSNNAIIAYVSPDHNVARIRLVTQGVQMDPLNSLYQDFPSGVDYVLTLTMEDADLTFLIEVPSTGQSWTFSAVDPEPRSGMFGFHIGEEPSAHWDWIQVDGIAEGSSQLTWFTTEDLIAGDGDMCLEPGETIALPVEVTNLSDETLQNAFGILQALNSELQVTGNYVEFGDIPGMGTAWSSGAFTVMAPLVTPEEAYEMRLTLMADGGYQHQMEFCLPVGCGIATDLESDSFGWTWSPAASGWENDWHVSSEMNHTPGGQFSFKCGDTGSGDYSDHHWAYLCSPYVNIPLDAECSYWSWLDAQQVSPSVANDGGMVQYRRLGEWIDLCPIPVCSHEAGTGSGPFAAGTPIYSGTFEWTEFLVPIPDSLAGPGEIRFLFGTDDSGNREGWYIDDFLIAGPTGVEQASSSLLQPVFLSASGNPVREAVTFSYCASGLSDPAVEIRDISGRTVAVLPATSAEGISTVLWETPSVPAGMYFASIRGSDTTPLKLVKF